MAQKSGLINTQLNIELKQLLENRGINADKIVVFGSYGRGDKEKESFCTDDSKGLVFCFWGWSMVPEYGAR